MSARPLPNHDTKQSSSTREAGSGFEGDRESPGADHGVASLFSTPVRLGALLSPATVLQLQRLHGNATTRRLLQTRPGLIQRTMYLADADSNIYKDSDNPAGEYAFVQKGGSALFVSYDAIQKIQADAGLKALQQNNSPRNFQKGLEDAFMTGQDPAPRLALLIGKVYFQDDASGGKVKEANVQPVVLAQIVLNILEHGAMYLNVGGGSRLPTAAGVVFVPNAQVTLTTILNALGIPPAKHGDYANVKVTPIPFQFAKIFEAARAKGPNTESFAYSNPAIGLNFVYVSGVEQTRSKNSRVQIDGKIYADDLSDLAGPNVVQVQTAFSKLSPPKADTGWVSGKTLVPIGREDGQSKAMNNWNALGAAAYANKFLGKQFDLNQSWEWLHIQGAQIGGDTKGGNLVPGLYATNSFMIPYETMIREWATSDPEHFAARFRAEAGGNVFATKIIISIMARGHRQLGNLEADPFISFDPLAGKVVDKFANEVIKRNLDAAVTAT